ncbi:MAG: FHA domain-containing protein [Pseudomonadales bacterium]|jgi:hypothetical protein|nr:FHA domain-containing protein [Pseudomonadales bacterium]
MAAKLILSFNDEQVAEFELDRESLTIGRRPESDIHIDNLAVSGQHARVMTIAGDSFLEDLDSTNGTFVNGKRIKKHALAAGDLVTIGKHSLRFVGADGSTQAPPNDGFAETIVISPGESAALRQEATSAEAARARQADVASGGGTRASGLSANVGPARLRLVVEGAEGKEMPLAKALTTIGKPGVQVAAISRRQNGDFIIHVDGGANEARPVVNGTVIGVKSQKLEDQDVIEIAGVRMQYLRG